MILWEFYSKFTKKGEELSLDSRYLQLFLDDDFSSEEKISENSLLSSLSLSFLSLGLNSELAGILSLFPSFSLSVCTIEKAEEKEKSVEEGGEGEGRVQFFEWAILINFLRILEYLYHVNLGTEVLSFSLLYLSYISDEIVCGVLKKALSSSALIECEKKILWMDLVWTLRYSVLSFFSNTILHFLFVCFISYI